VGASAQSLGACRDLANGKFICSSGKCSPHDPSLLAHQRARAHLLARCLLRDAASRASKTGSFSSFDLPDSTQVNPSAINPAGTIAGYYFDSSSLTHSFVRTPAGVVTAFDPPGTVCSPNAGICSGAVGVSPGGDIAGWFSSSTGDVDPTIVHGYLKSAPNIVKTFDPPGSVFTFPAAMNAAGQITGTYSDVNFNGGGFIRRTDGSFVTFAVPGSSSTTTPVAINAAGTVAGWYFDSSFTSHLFLRDTTGAITTFDVPGSAIAQPTAIDPTGAVFGWAVDDTTTNYHGFLRAKSGALTKFDVLDATDTFPTAVNAAGFMTGWYISPADLLLHGFVRNRLGEVRTFDPPGSFETFPLAISPSGAVTGWFDDGAIHGFVGVP
jgi:predicted membrane protein